MSASVWELFDMTDRVAIVTGGTGLLGSEICDALAEAGANVVVASRTATDCERKAEELSREHEESIAVPVDVRDEESVQSMVAEVVDEFGRIDVLVNNAYCGEGYGTPFEDLSLSEWESMIDGVLTQTFLCSQAALPELRADEGGAILNVGSIYGVVAPDHRMYGDTGMNNPPNYGAAKAGVIQLTKWLATYLASDDVRVNSVSPGGFYSEAYRRGEADEDYEEVFLPNYEDRTPMGRMGVPDDIKGIALYLASDASKWMTGQNVVLDGGWTAW